MGTCFFCHSKKKDGGGNGIPYFTFLPTAKHVGLEVLFCRIVRGGEAAELGSDKNQGGAKLTHNFASKQAKLNS